jgi:hypothetical protein
MVYNYLKNIERLKTGEDCNKVESSADKDSN